MLNVDFLEYLVDLARPLATGVARGLVAVHARIAGPRLARLDADQHGPLIPQRARRRRRRWRRTRRASSESLSV
jgi:hypothetical protein